MIQNIKFRAKDIDHKEWCYGLIHNDGINLFPVEIDTNTIGQFIGRKDNTKKEIYEGDIITVNGHYPKIVQFIQEKAGFCIANICDFKNQDLWDIWQQPPTIWWDEMEIKVIGNVFENPELLEE